MIDIKDLKKVYGANTVLSIDALTIERGECIGIVGNNGAGKSTLLNLILDLIQATKGVIQLKGIPVARNDEWKTYTGSFLNEGFLIPYLTPKEFLEFIGSLHGKSSSEVKNFLEENAHFYTEDINSNKYLRELSAGNKNKVGILAALLTDPELLLLDEPFANLDPSSQSVLKTKLKKMHEDGVTILISSHDLNHVTEVCSRILLLEKGIIVKDKKTNAETLSELEKYFNV